MLALANRLIRTAGMVAVGVALVAVAVGCGGGDDDDGGGSGPGGAFGGGSGSGSTGGNTGGSSGSGQPAIGSNAGSSGAGSCEVKLTGDITGDYKGTGDSGSVGSDYWFSEKELREALGFLQSGTDAEKKKKVDELMAQDPRLFLLIINCEADKVSVSLLPTGDSKYKDVPFKTARKYPVQPGIFGGSDVPGTFTALLTIGDEAYGVAKEGQLSITKFDESGISGTFEFEIEEAFSAGTAKKAKVSGKFSYPCSGGEICRK